MFSLKRFNLGNYSKYVSMAFFLFILLLSLFLGSLYNKEGFVEGGPSAPTRPTKEQNTIDATTISKKKDAINTLLTNAEKNVDNNPSAALSSLKEIRKSYLDPPANIAELGLTSDKLPAVNATINSAIISLTDNKAVNGIIKANPTGPDKANVKAKITEAKKTFPAIKQ